MFPKTLFQSHHFIAILLSVASVAAFFRIYSRIKITLLGYEIGRIREMEEQLLKKRSLLTMEYAKITTRDYLMRQAEKAPPVDFQRPIAEK